MTEGNHYQLGNLRMAEQWIGRTDIGHGGSDANFHPRVSLLRQLALEELIQFGIENTIGHELPPF